MKPPVTIKRPLTLPLSPSEGPTGQELRPRQWFKGSMRGLLAGGLIAVALTSPAFAANETAPETEAPASSAEVRHVTAGELQAAIDRGVEFLVKRQNPNGSWGSPTKTKDLNIFAPVPGAHHAFEAGTSGLALQGLIETGAWKTNAAARAAMEKGEEWMLTQLSKLRRGSTVAIYNVWGHAYGTRALVAMHNRDGQTDERKKRIKEAIAEQIKLIEEYESVAGGWGYYDFDIGAKKPASDTTSFTSSTVLLALHEARKLGLEAPERLTKRALDSIQRQRKPDNSYYYGEYLWARPMRDINRPAGSLGRSQACNLTLRHWGDKTITDEVMIEWLDRLVKRNGWLSIGRKRPVPHEAWFQVAGYFYYYGHYYAALCVEELGPKGDQFKQDLVDILVPLQEADGSWFDYPLYDYGHSYATGYALSTLVRLRN